jgi:hypothetical protein
MGISPKLKKNTKKQQGVGFAKNPTEIIGAVVVIILLIAVTIKQISSGQFSSDGGTSTPPPPSSTAAAIGATNNGRGQTGAVPGSNTGKPDGSSTSGNNDASSNLGLGSGDGRIANVGSPAPSPNDGIDIMTKIPNRPRTGKMVMVQVAESGRSNPFLPAAENFVPKAVSKLHLPPPPKQVFPNSNAAKIITTTISGIMYDKYSPSAIINIAGTDFLVRRGDIVNKYRILSITPNQVTVQYGNNIYRAGVGQILSLSDVKFNPIANLNSKFGGNVHRKRL